MIRLSPGFLFASYRLVIRANKEKLKYSSISNNIANFEGVCIDDLLETCQKCKWIEINEDYIQIGINGRSIAKKDLFDEQIKRQMIKDFILESVPSWGLLITRGRNESIPFFDTDIQMCFHDANLLLRPIPSDCLLWWDEIALSMYSEKDAKKLLIGRKGEMLSLQYEYKRNGKYAELQSIESNLLGYDILSSISKKNNSPLLIEVKTSDNSIKDAKAHISRNEWEVALASKNYIFHFWCTKTSPTLAIISVQQLIGNMPVDSGLGVWKEAEIPFKIFENSFVNVD